MVCLLGVRMKGVPVSIWLELGCCGGGLDLLLRKMMMESNPKC